MDELQREVLEGLRAFLREVREHPEPRTERLTPLGELVEEHLGAPISELPVLVEGFPPHRLVDVDLALERIAEGLDGAAGGRLLGITGGQQRDHAAFPELLRHAWISFAPGPVDYVSAASGPGATRRTVSTALRLLEFAGARLAVLQRNADPMHGRAEVTLEVMSADPSAASALLAEIRRLSLELSVLRGRVLSFEADDFGGPRTAGTTFLPRPEVSAESVILPAGVLDRLDRHVLGIGEHRERVRAAGRHLRRGILLYGPPGTGKTQTIRHLLSRAEGITAVVLAGRSIGFIREAASLARAMQPAIVVLEDIDLIAEDRSVHGPQPMLFALLDTLDGLGDDADIAFVMTTNRLDALERALAERPGRVDLAIEIPRPRLPERERLFRLYAEGLSFSPEAVAEAARRSDGVTGSFAKEVMRRAVLDAAVDGREPDDGDLRRAIDELGEESSRMTRALIGGGTPES